jgi:hypothetical protein
MLLTGLVTLGLVLASISKREEKKERDDQANKAQ